MRTATSRLPTGEVYFHKKSVLNDDFDHVKIGTEVTFVEEEGDRGPQASSVKFVGRHRCHKVVGQSTAN